jgi:hypothetical protein
MTRAIDEFFTQLFFSIMWWLLRLFMHLTSLLVQLLLPVIEELMAVVGQVLLRLVVQPLVWSFAAIIVLWALTDHGIFASVAALTAIAGVVVFVMVRERTF